MTSFTAIAGTAQNVHPQYVGDSIMNTQNPTRTEEKKIVLIKNNCWRTISQWCTILPAFSSSFYSCSA